jgi:hypothetical protein
MRVLVPVMSSATLAVIAALSCTIDGPGSMRPVRSVAVMPGQTNGVVGDRATFGVVVRDDAGNIIKARNVQWSSSNEQVARVSSSGLVEAVGPGSVVITATVGDVTGNSLVNLIDTVPSVALPPDTSTPPPPTGPPPTAEPSPTPSTSVASVTVVPEALTLGLLGTAQFTAVLRDNQNRLLSGRTVSWAALDGLIAGINPVGIVNGLLAGTTTVRATSEGVSGEAPLSVALGAQSSPPGWTNMPTGFKPLTDESFGASLRRNWFLIWNDAGNGSMIVDVSSPFSPGRVFQVKYPAGFVAGEAPATLVYDLGRIRNVFVGIWWKASAGWQGHESNVNKIQFLFPSDGNGDIYMAAYGSPGGPYELRCALQLVNADTRAWLRPNVDPGVVTMGAWHRIEWLLQYNTPGQRNGVVRWWMDGKLVGDYRDILFSDVPLDNYKISPTWGGVGGAKSQTDYYWYDHVFIAWR